jgi:hypothetical protein
VAAASRFTEGQVDQAFWFIPGPNGFIWSILSPEVPFEERRDCIRAIPNLFRTVFCDSQGMTAGYMWWDSVFSYCAIDGKNLATELDVLEEVAAAIVEMTRDECRGARSSGAHGVQHLEKLSRSTGDTRIAAILTKIGLD